MLWRSLPCFSTLSAKDAGGYRKKSVTISRGCLSRAMKANFFRIYIGTIDRHLRIRSVLVLHCCSQWPQEQAGLAAPLTYRRSINGGSPEASFLPGWTASKLLPAGRVLVSVRDAIAETTHSQLLAVSIHAVCSLQVHTRQSTGYIAISISLSYVAVQERYVICIANYCAHCATVKEATAQTGCLRVGWGPDV